MLCSRLTTYLINLVLRLHREHTVQFVQQTSHPSRHVYTCCRLLANPSVALASARFHSTGRPTENRSYVNGLITWDQVAPGTHKEVKHGFGFSLPAGEYL